MANQQAIAALQSQIDSILSNGGKPSRDVKSGSKAVDFGDSNAALKKIVALVNASDKSEHSIRERLAREGYEDYAIDEAVSLARDYGFVDDARFADVLIRSRIAQLKGSAGILRELAEHDIDPASISGWPYDYPVSHDEEIDRATELLVRKPPHAKNKREGAYRRLMQKGYPSSVASSAARMWSESL